MVQGQLVIALARAALAGEVNKTADAVRAIRDAEAAGKANGGIAHALDEQLRRSSGAPARAKWVHGGRDTVGRPHKGARHVETVEPRISLDDLRLTPIVRRTVEDLADEQRHAAKLRDAGMRPRSRIMLVGPPGNGKTSLAEAIAHRLDLVLHLAAYDSLIASLLGETGTHLKHVFDYIAQGPAVTLFDEAEALLRERDDKDDTGEMKRVTAQLLTRLERLPDHTIVVAATNHPGMLDRASRRRFDIRLEMPAPDDTELRDYVSERLKPRVGDHTAIITRRVMHSIPDRSYAEAAMLCDDLIRRLIIEPDRSPLDVAVERLTPDRPTSQMTALGTD